MLQLGKLNQMVVVVGYIPHELTLATNQAGDYILKFNVRTFDNEGTPCLIPCIADTKIAKNLYDEFEERDTLVVWGQLRHKYSQKYHQTFLQLKVISYSIVVDLDDFLYEPSMSEEKKSFLKKMSDLFDEQAPEPTEEEIAFWREHWREYKKTHYDEKIKKERKKKKDSD